MNKIIVIIVKNISIAIPQGLLYGMISPDIKNNVEPMEVNLVIIWIKIKTIKFIGVIPAIEHNTSSGNIGSKNIKNKITVSFPFNFFKYSSTLLGSPTIQLTKRLPITLPKKKASSDPKNIPINEYK